ncbi:MAG: ATP-binding domain-containing protein [Candidatus Omnitrophota bacterium]
MINFYEALVNVAIMNPDSTSEETVALIENKFLQLQFTKIYRLTQGTYVLTIHQAKGKEFDHVIMPYVDDRSFADSLYFKKVFYVGVTRAKKSVTILFPEKGKSPILDQFS